MYCCLVVCMTVTPSFFLQFNFSFGCIVQNRTHIFYPDCSIRASTPIAAHSSISLAAPCFFRFFPDFTQITIYYAISIKFSRKLRHITLPPKFAKYFYTINTKQIESQSKEALNTIQSCVAVTFSNCSAPDRGFE